MSINAETGHQTQASIGGRILRMRDLRERLGLTASHIYAMVAAGRFPKPFPIIPGGRATGWLESTIDAYLTNCSTAAPEPVAYFDPQKREFYWARPTQIDAPTTVDVPPLPLYAAPPPAAPIEDIETLRRDAERLREALQWIASRCPTNQFVEPHRIHLEAAHDAGACARAALKEVPR